MKQNDFSYCANRALIQKGLMPLYVELLMEETGQRDKFCYKHSGAKDEEFPQKF